MIFFQQHTFFYSIYYIIKYNIELIFANTSIIEYWFFFGCWNIFFPELHSLLVYFYCFIFKKNNAKNIDDFSLIQKKKHTAKSRYTVNKIVIFIAIFLRDSRFFLTSSLYRSMWTIGQSQHVEEKIYRPIVHKIRYTETRKTVIDTFQNLFIEINQLYPFEKTYFRFQICLKLHFFIFSSIDRKLLMQN